MNFQQFVAAYKDAERGTRDKDPAHYWRCPLDRIITSACRDNSGHSDVCEVFAKVAIVNRMYRTKLELGGEDQEWQVAEALVMANTDEILTHLNQLGTFGQETMRAVLDSHTRLVQIIHEATNRDEVSFISKYLNFHVPKLVPIIDRRAEARAREITAGVYGMNKGGRYEQHLNRLLYLLNQLSANDVMNPDLKLVDHVLYGERDS
jgi:hypothetical protein